MLLRGEHNQPLDTMKKLKKLLMTIVALATLFGTCSQFGTLLQAAQTVTLAWDTNSEPDLAGHILYTGRSSGSYTLQMDVGNVNIVTVSNLQEGLTYFFVVTAYNTARLESEYSNEVAYTVPGQPDPVALAPPVDSSDSSGPAVTLSWTASAYPNVTGYILCFGAASGVYAQTNNLGNVTQVRLTGLVPGQTYYFTVIVTGLYGVRSAPSNEASYRVPLLDASYTASTEFGIDYSSGLISGNVASLPADAKTVYWAKNGLSVAPGQILSLAGRMYLNGSGPVSVYLADEPSGNWLSPERVIYIDSGYGQRQTDLVVFSGSTQAKLYIVCGWLAGQYQFQQTAVNLASPTVRPLTDLYVRQLLPRQAVGLYSVEWYWPPVQGAAGYRVRKALLRAEIEKGATGVLLGQQLLAPAQTTYRQDIDSTLYGGIYLSVSTVSSSGQESTPWITWYLPGDILNTADDFIPPLGFAASVTSAEMNYAYQGYLNLWRTPALTAGEPAGWLERMDIDNNAYAGRTSDYGFIRSQYFNARRLR